MEENKELPFEKLTQDCNVIGAVNSKSSILKIKLLSDTYPSEYLIKIYNYFFEVSDNYEILMFLLTKIDKYRDKSSIPLLIDSLLMKGKLAKRIPDSDLLTRIRVNITKALANTKDSRAVYPLLYCLNSKDENYKVKLSCAEALGKIGDRYAVLPLMNIVEDEAESSAYVKESAISALGMLGDTKAVDSLVSILESKKGFLGKFTFLKERALEALNKLNYRSDRVFKAVEKSLLDESPQVRINAIEVLMNSEDDRAEGLIKSMLDDPCREVVQNAVIALYNLIGDTVLDEIIIQDGYSETAKQEAIKLKDDLLCDDINETENDDE